MTALKQLEIEYNGICGIIWSYTKDAALKNYFEQLKIGIDKKDYELTKYTLECILNWYKGNIERIQRNSLDATFDSHLENMDIIERIYNRLNPDDFQIQNTKKPIQKGNKIIFLSHKSEDEPYATALRDFICGLGIKDKQLIYTSHALHKIPFDANIYDYLRDNISSEIFMIILWSDKYLESPACLNEMGAAWVVQSDYSNIYVPDFNFGNPKYGECAVDTNKMGAVLNGDEHCKQNMLELKDKICKMFNLTVDEKKATFLLDEFINTLNEINEK